MQTIRYRPLGPPRAVMIEIQGSLRGPVAAELRSLVRHLAAHDIRWIVCDLSSVASVDSQGIGVLLLVRRLCGSFGGRLHLLRPCESVWSLFEAMGIDTLFEVTEDIEALKALLRREDRAKEGVP